ncbi:MAG: aminomethyl-transferring glycine dehydrogenase [bacterium]|nr:aminomethyl-transferring glycine dehydrogenase [bacterium]MDE0601275.1 aminomethyl-transferring glycine dehydrogenase [bacterium]
MTSRQILDFSSRHIGLRPDDIAAMLERVGADSIDQLMNQTVPSSIRMRDSLDLPTALSEPGALRSLGEIASRNRAMTSLIGMGYYNVHVPSVILRTVLENPAWYTAYTPYQPEISQGRLEALLNFQTMVSDLTGMEISNASLLDEGTAAAEAMTMARRISRRRRAVRFWVDVDAFPQTIDVIQARARWMDIDVAVAHPDDMDFLDGESFGLLLQYPGASGEIRDLIATVEEAKAAGMVVVVATDLMALTLLSPPGEWGADIAVGSSQRFGVPMMFGGPHAGFIATLERHVRSLPGRLAGMSKDANGDPALRLALQTREQHIRRQRATSNICTAQVLLAVIASFYGAWHGPKGLTAIAQRINGLTSRVAAGLRSAGWGVENSAWFDTLSIRAGRAADLVMDRALSAGINLRRIDRETVGISLDETTDEEIASRALSAFAATLPTEGTEHAFPRRLSRQSDFMTHPVFNTYHSEHEMLRYIRRLSDRDLALDRTMIPLGSCTMKLNPASSMIPVTWPEFSDIHPFVPIDQAQGYLQLFGDLEDWLTEITGYAAVSLQPNAGSQGELAGLAAIRAYHLDRGEDHRRVCLIPSSAHGTNAASAAMAGMRIVVVNCDDQGNIDLVDLKEKLVRHGEQLAAIMITYPSTHGVFEESVAQVCEMVHGAGGQVYVDGANLNALVGLAQPGRFGADVSHLNLHKTFTIPHGGGGPGVGPVAVGAHLAPYLPNHPLQPDAGPSTGIGPISAAPWGSAGILPIPWMYMRMMGGDGLKRASEIAILAANYLTARLSRDYRVLYVGDQGRVAHEVIIDLREFGDSAGVSAEDVAKRLTDYGFHAPTLSFPVPGTLMIEPTESEPLAELDRFCDAMHSIREEIRRIETGEWPRDDNPLHHAPHTSRIVTADQWNRSYPRSVAAYPGSGQSHDKYWSPVGRVDSVEGDRNLQCSCPPIESYMEE